MGRPHLVAVIKREHRRNIIPPLVFLVVGSLFLSILTVYELNYEDHVPIVRGTLLFLFGLVFFTCLYLLLNNIFAFTNWGKKFVKNYKISPKQILQISNKAVSAVQAVFCCITGITSCSYSCSRDVLKTSHYISEAYAWFGAAYFFYDIWSMYKVDCAKYPTYQINGTAKEKTLGIDKLFYYLRDNFIIIAHHLFIGGFGFLVITYLRGGLGDCFFGFIYLMEASTPFVSIRGILSQMGLRESKLYIVNGIIMLVSFFLCRIIMFPYVIHMYGRNVGLDFISAVNSLPRGCKIGITILLLPQLYWGYLMIKGATKILITKPSNNNTVKPKKKHKHSH